MGKMPVSLPRSVPKFRARTPALKLHLAHEWESVRAEAGSQVFLGQHMRTGLTISRALVSLWSDVPDSGIFAAILWDERPQRLSTSRQFPQYHILSRMKKKRSPTPTKIDPM